MAVDDKGQQIDESWEFATGLIDDFDGLIVSTEFGTKPDYTDSEGSPQVLFIARVLADGTTEPVDTIFSVGKGWEIADGGRSVSRPDGKLKFMQSSLYAMLLARARGLWPDITKRGATNRTGLLDGTRWHWKREKIEYGGRIEAKEHIMVTSFLGQGQVPAGMAAPGSAGGGVGSNDEIRAEVEALALQHDTHKAFLTEFLKDKELMGKAKGAGLLTEIMSPKDTGLWAKTRAAVGVA